MIEFIGNNYIPSSIGRNKPHNYTMVFDLEEAKKYIKENFNLQEIEKIIAGLDGSFFQNNDYLYINGQWNERFEGFNSDQDNPIFVIYFDHAPRKTETYKCWHEL